MLNLYLTVVLVVLLDILMDFVHYFLDCWRFYQLVLQLGEIFEGG